MGHPWGKTGDLAPFLCICVMPYATYPGNRNSPLMVRTTL